LNRVPLAALPGRDANTYLLEERAFAVIPVPQLLPAVLQARRLNTAAESPDGLLLVGDVDFDAAPGMSLAAAEPGRTPRRTRAGALQNWPPLPATRSEIQSIEHSFQTAAPQGRVTALTAAGATESALRAAAPQHRYLHLATHGFFAPEELKSALAGSDTGGHENLEAYSERRGAGLHPGLLSGLALAGANRPAGEGDDGVLTALEVAGMDLRGIDLAVLSACDTGRGQVAGGEGVLGLQRAFAVAGVQSTITSLWKVDDTATQRLMERFYENLLVKKQTRLDALREAQLWMLTASRSGDEATRGIVRESDSAEAPADPSGPTPPYYWAAFVLSGDWR